MADIWGLPQLATLPTQKQCPRCKEPATKTCGGCKNITYCSAECQQADWPTHKILCGTFKDFAQHPSAGKCRVVAFLPGETKPRFMWATLVDEGSYMTFDAQSLFPTSERYESKITIHHNAWTDTGLDYELHVYFTTRATDFYPLPNQAVYTACGGLRPKFSYEFNFHGPIFAFCGRLGKFLRDPEYEHELVQAHDMDMRTYAHLVAYLTYYYNKGFASLKGPKVPCVKVACEGERKSGTPSHQTVRVPRTHPIFIGQGVSSKISEVYPPFYQSDCNE